MIPIFWQLSAVCLRTKYNKLLWICLFSAKNLSNFVFHSWKLDNPYYHILYKSPHVTLKSLMTRCIDQVMIIGWKNILMKHSPVSSYRTMGWYNLWKTILFFLFISYSRSQGIKSLTYQSKSPAYDVTRNFQKNVAKMGLPS